MQNQNLAVKLKNGDWCLHWFRRDLRLIGNQALKKSWQISKGRTLGLFCFDSQFLSRSDFSFNRFAFFLKTLKQLKLEMRQHGGELLVVDCQAQEFFGTFIDYLKEHNLEPPRSVSWSRDYEPYARTRDFEIEELFRKKGITFFSQRDHLLIEPWEIQRSDGKGSFYQVYSPFAKSWLTLFETDDIQKRVLQNSKLSSYVEKQNSEQIENIFSLNWSETFLKQRDFKFQDSLEEFIKKSEKNVTVNIPEAGIQVAYKQLMQFCNRIEDYSESRNFPDRQGTSKLSIYLKNGSLTSAQIFYYLKSHFINFLNHESSRQYCKELIWREFFYSVMYHYPENEKQSFIEKYRLLKWQNNKSWFERWKQGMTGFPIVDAGMRELNQTGWMHNRVRMIVASFLTKDLLIDWRWGENYFMKQLLDGDLAPNNGGWQWAASTGCDPQPYFRIFNPFLQSQKFDPDAKYIKKYIPELQNFSAREIHSSDSDLTAFGYPQRVVDHGVQKQKALELFKKI